MGRNWKSACHTCRRRRLRCDEAKPLCQRCAAAGIECQGYGNLILWVDGVASRGKMMGKSFSQAPAIPDGTNAVASPACARPSTVSSYRERVDPFPNTAPSILQYSLLDPWLQQMGDHTRHYLSHFLTNVGNDLVVHNLPSSKPNPLRGLLEFAERNPALFHVVIAMSANHMHNLLKRTPEAQKYHIDGLRFKGRALQLLSQDLMHITSANYTAVLASSMLLSELALLESGDDTWRIHVGAAARLVQGITMSSSTDPQGLGVEQYSFCSWIISRLILQDMFGSSLSSTTASWNIQELCSSHPSIDSALRIAELDHYSSCPAQISRLIIATSSLYRTPGYLACHDQPTGCISSSIQEFDPSDWALALQPFTPTDDFTERYHIGSAYKAAAALYASQLPPSEYACPHLPTEPQDLVNEILHHISLISRTNPLFKSTIWPMSIAGAETTNPAHRAQVLLHLGHLSVAIPWQSTYGVEQALKEFWRRIDRSDSLPSDQPHRERRWLDEFRTMGLSFYPA
ncbi:fungal-specific transcription factor domain-containing protein [Aspergillus granulosus]|uniref:Fungal-specific transcription factor domain-containing protein n=1 Tax=Aspergillus granulosus TaxID=176169 RepID=A0ABR4GW21_9EURO